MAINEPTIELTLQRMREKYASGTGARAPLQIRACFQNQSGEGGAEYEEIIAGAQLHGARAFSLSL